ncbi:hypothetical protein WA158_000818 [Blastocystis sp. Blastoise]
MVKEKVEFDANKMGDIQKDVIHFERLIGDLIGILSKSISFCIHSGESINELVKQSVRNYEGMNDKNGDDPHIIIQESSYVHETDATINDNDNGIDYIRFTNNGPVYSLPKRITNSLVGSLLYEYSQENQRTNDGNIYLDYHGDETVAPLLIDSLMNKKIDIDKLIMKDQIDLLRMFEYCELPIPEELINTYYRIDYNMKQYKEDDKVTLYINGKKDEVLRDYWKKNGLWNKIINDYCYGYVDYDVKYYEMFIKMNYKYIDHIYEYILYNCVYISEEEATNKNIELLEKEMYSLFGDKGMRAIIEAMFPYSYLPGTKILTNNSMEIPLMTWLGKEKKWKLLFRSSDHKYESSDFDYDSSENEYKASEFHKCCDNKGETVTLIKHIGHNGHINIFGGYTDQNWESSSVLKPYSKEFLFTLSNEHNIPPTQYDYTNSDRNYGIYCNSSYGPFFNDICICYERYQNMTSYCSASRYSEVNTPQKSSLFVNTDDANSINYFKVQDYEVWGRA